MTKTRHLTMSNYIVLLLQIIKVIFQMSHHFLFAVPFYAKIIISLSFYHEIKYNLSYVSPVKSYVSYIHMINIKRIDF